MDELLPYTRPIPAAITVKTSMPPAPPLWLMAWNHDFIIGSMIFHIYKTTSVQATPAIKLLVCGLREGRYKKPLPAECGGMIKMS
jgi:hypothetical protein